MARFVLLHRGHEPNPEDLQLIESAPGVKIVDKAQHRAMLLEGSEEAVGALSGRLRNWLVASEVSYRRPELGPEEPDAGE